MPYFMGNDLVVARQLESGVWRTPFEVRMRVLRQQLPEPTVPVIEDVLQRLLDNRFARRRARTETPETPLNRGSVPTMEWCLTDEGVRILKETAFPVPAANEQFATV